jgi:F-type H+-transporting ATPase subunit c
MKKNYFWLAIAGVLFPMVSFADDAAHAVNAGSTWTVPIGIGFAIGLAVLGATMAQGRIAGSFMDGASRNPGAGDVMRTPFILGLAFVESLVLFAVLIAFMLLGKI